VQPAVVEQLLAVNRAFYQSLGETFAASRTRPQPGVLRALTGVGGESSVIDVGCGHGLAATALEDLGFHGRYLGIDGSTVLLELAKRRVARPWAVFHWADLARRGWAESPALSGGAPFDWGLAFSVFHHFPGEEMRQRLATDLRRLIHDGGRAAISVWQFLNRDRFRTRIVDWSEIGLTASDVDTGDALLDWRRDGYGLRYVHHFLEEELAGLASRAGFDVEETFRSDGEGGRLGLYQRWRVA